MPFNLHLKSVSLNTLVTSSEWWTVDAAGTRLGPFLPFPSSTQGCSAQTPACSAGTQLDRGKLLSCSSKGRSCAQAQARGLGGGGDAASPWYHPTLPWTVFCRVSATAPPLHAQMQGEQNHLSLRCFYQAGGDPTGSSPHPNTPIPPLAKTTLPCTMVSSNLFQRRMGCLRGSPQPDGSGDGGKGCEASQHGGGEGRVLGLLPPGQHPLPPQPQPLACASWKR